MQNNLSHALTVATKLSYLAGDIIRKQLVLGAKVEWKSDDTPVTLVDKQINQLVIDTIHETFPDHSILAEEGSDLTRSTEFVWVCDPIDGTTPFMHGIPISTFALALVHHGQPVIGIIYDPYMDRLFSAVKGLGTKLNGQEVHTSKDTSLNNTTVGTVFWKGNMDIFAPLLTKLTDKGGKILDLCSISYMDALVAVGQFSAVIFPGQSAHDSAAAKIIVEEAGGVFTSLTGEIDRYDRPVHGHIACANADIHKQIVSLLR